MPFINSVVIDGGITRFCLNHISSTYVESYDSWEVLYMYIYKQTDWIAYRIEMECHILYTYSVLVKST